MFWISDDGRIPPSGLPSSYLCACQGDECWRAEESGLWPPNPRPATGRFRDSRWNLKGIHFSILKSHSSPGGGRPARWSGPWNGSMRIWSKSVSSYGGKSKKELTTRWWPMACEFFSQQPNSWYQPDITSYIINSRWTHVTQSYPL